MSESNDSARRFQALVEEVSDLVAVVDDQGRPLYLSPSHTRVLGYELGELMAMNLWSLIHTHDLPSIRVDFRRVLRERHVTVSHPVRLRSKRGEWCTLSVVLTDLRDDPAVGGIVCNSRDITEQSKLEQQLRRTQKMESLGQLAGGIAHEFNNVLAAIIGYAQLVHDDLPESDERRGDLAEILRAADRGAEVAKQLLVFSRHQSVETEVLDLAALVRGTSQTLRELLPKSITLDVNASEQAPVYVRGVRGQLERMVMNLATNARDAMPEGGRLDIEVGLRPQSTGTRSATLVVRDTGSGIAPEVQSRLFEPFFTTKSPGRGAGLGLAAVYGIVRQCGGDIDVQSHEGNGAVFTVALPIAEVPSSTSAFDVSGAPTRSATILVVDDDDAVRSVARRVLERAGFQVKVARDGMEAAEMLRRDASSIDCVLTDAAMPGMSGRDLALYVAQQYAHIPVVLMSGYEAEPRSSGGEHIAGFAQKPFSSERLVRILREALAPH